MLWVWGIAKGIWGNPIGRKVILGLVGFGVIFWAFRYYGNKREDEGFRMGGLKMQKTMEVEMLKQAEIVQKSIDAEKQKYLDGIKQNESDRRVLAVQASELERARQQIAATLAKIVAKAEANAAAGYQSTSTLTDTTVDDAIRRVSNELEQERVSGGTNRPQ